MLDRIYIEIGNRCNLSCSFCPSIAREKKTMNLVEFEKIISQCAPLARQVFLHLMGEPLIHPDFERIIDLCQQADAPVQITTNGTVLTPSMEKILSSSIIRQINFSLHGLQDNFPDKGPEEFLLPVLQCCRNVQKANSSTYINLRFWNIDQVGNDQLLDLVEEFYGVSFNRRTEEGAIKSKKIGDHLYLHFDTRFIWPELSNPLRGKNGRCHALFTQIGILADGQVVPCCLDKDGIMSLGNCLETPLVDILNSPRALAMSEGFTRGELVEKLCQHCDYISRFDKKGRR